MKKRIVITLAASLAATALIGGCAKNNEDAAEVNNFTTNASYPIDTDVTLRYWTVLNSNVSASNTSLNTTEFKEYLENATGVKLKFEHPVAGQEDAAFNILQSSDDMPDIVEWDWFNVKGGPQKAIDDGIILNLNSYIENVSPNLKKIIDSHPEWSQLFTTDEGNYFQYPFIREDDKLSTYVSYVIRKDLLDKIGMDTPRTLDEWEKVLYKFKEIGIKSPISIRLNSYYFSNYSLLTGAFGFAGGLYHDENGVVKYGPYEDSFRDYVTTLNRWYKDGILDAEFADVDKSRRAAMVTNGENGIIDAAIGGELGNYLNAIKPESGIEYVAIAPPVKNKDDNVFYTQKDWPVTGRAAISATSKYPEIAARFLDFGYGEEGHMLYNFGKQGDSYEFKDTERGSDIPTYSDLVVNPDKNGGLSIAQGLAKYCRAGYNGPFVQDIEYIYQYYKNPVQKKALDVNQSDTLKYKMPPLYYTTEEQKIFTDAMTAIRTYQEETMINLISGKLDLSYLDTYYSQLESMGIKDVIDVTQKAYDRALKRSATEKK